MTRCAAALALLTALALAGCAARAASDPSKGAPASWSSGKADGSFDIVEEGALALGTEQSVALGGRVRSYRVESYGGTTLDVTLRGQDGADPLLVVEGPLPGSGDATPPGAGAVLAQDDDSAGGLDAHLVATLAQPGVYRVIAGTYGSLGLGEAPGDDELSLDARCTAACSRPEITSVELLRRLRDSGKLDALLAQADGQLERLIPDETLRAALRTQLHDIAASQDFAGLDRFPTVPLRQIGTVRPALGLVDAKEPSPDAVVDGDLATLLGDCNADRSPPPPVHATLPEIGNGHFADLSLPACTAAHGERLAQLLTSLAADNGSVVRYAGQELRTPRDLVQALIENGHTFEVRNERTYANFISLTLGTVDVRWPVWLDTGVALEDGRSLVVPMGHSHHAWRISGPVVNARVMFYLGISGAAFFAQTRTRPAWTGAVARDVTSDPDMVLSTFDVAARYLRRTRLERTTVAAGMPADGYGFVGVCNDSNAVLEYATRGTVSAFPLMRAASLDAQPDVGDGLDAVFHALPHDSDGAPDRADVFARVLAMTPLDLDSPDLPDELLRTQLRQVAAASAATSP